MKKLLYAISFCLVLSISAISAIPKPGPMILLTLENKMVHQDGYLYLDGLTNFYKYYLTARSYDAAVNSSENLTKHPGDAIRTQLSVFEVRSDRYEFTIVACGFSTSGVMDLLENQTLVFPLCAKSEYGTNWVQEKIIQKQIVECLEDPSGVSCQKQIFMLLMRGNKGEEKAKVRKPPSLERLDLEELGSRKK